MRKGIIKIYKSRRHFLFTLFIVVSPFVLLLFFSRITHIAAGTLFLDLFISFWRLLVAYVIAVILAWICAVSFYKGKSAAVALPIFDVLQSFPTFAALPLATLLWGPSNSTVILFLVVTVIWPIFFSIISSLKLIKRDWEEVVDIMGVRGWRYLKDFLLPVSIPGLITGSIIGLGEGWEALVATEIIIGIQSGLGNFFQSSSSDPTVTVFGILGLLIVIFVINRLLWLPLLEWGHERTED